MQRWIEAGQVLRAGRPLKASYRVSQGDVVTIFVPAPEEYNVEPEDIPLDILYEDADLLVINKAAGMVVHPAAGNWHGTLVNAVLFHAPDLEGVGGVHRPGIVHRLDKDTSGVILVAKNDASHRDLQAQFQARTVHKEYLALAVGVLQPAAGEIDAALGRDPRDRQRMAVRPAGQGRPSRTQYETLGIYRARPSGERLSLLACHPLTGRTHQIRGTWRTSTIPSWATSSTAAQAALRLPPPASPCPPAGVPPAVHGRDRRIHRSPAPRPSGRVGLTGSYRLAG